MTTPRPDHEECCKKSFGASLADTAKRLLENPSLAPREIQEARLARCEKCPSYVNTRCELCGCFMQPKVKFSNVRCPAGYWTEHVPDSEV